VFFLSEIWRYLLSRTRTHTQPVYGPLGFCPGLPGWGDTRKVKPGRQNQSGFTGARVSEWQWHQLGHSISAPWPRHLTTPISHHSVFLRAGWPSAVQATASQHWRHLLSRTLDIFKIWVWFKIVTPIKLQNSAAIFVLWTSKQIKFIQSRRTRWSLTLYIGLRLFHNKGTKEQ